jgi:hypothetical protein
MKNSMDHLKHATPATEEPCSEQKCATCFENRGCMFEQYVGALMNKIEETYQANRANEIVPQLSRRA